MSKPEYLYDFGASKSNDWYVVDDGVMGGLSQGKFFVNEEGHGVFHGEVSLENNGGFSSVRHPLDMNIEGNKSVVLRVKGDGKRYQFRLKKNNSDYHSYIQYFETSGKWETIELDLDEFYPSFRGRKLDMDNYAPGKLQEIRFLIANYKAESFKLEIDWIKVK
jgi:hypothetical protein